MKQFSAQNRAEQPFTKREKALYIFGFLTLFILAGWLLSSQLPERSLPEEPFDHNTKPQPFVPKPLKPAYRKRTTVPEDSSESSDNDTPASTPDYSGPIKLDFSPWSLKQLKARPEELSPVMLAAFGEQKLFQPESKLIKLFQEELANSTLDSINSGQILYILAEKIKSDDKLFLLLLDQMQTADPEKLLQVLGPETVAVLKITKKHTGILAAGIKGLNFEKLFAASITEKTEMLKPVIKPLLLSPDLYESLVQILKLRISAKFKTRDSLIKDLNKLIDDPLFQEIVSQTIESQFDLKKAAAIALSDHENFLEELLELIPVHRSTVNSLLIETGVVTGFKALFVGAIDNMEMVETMRGQIMTAAGKIPY